MDLEQKAGKLIFHIGHRKTGTTSIQGAFATGRVSLEGQRVLYPSQMAHNYLRAHFVTWLDKGSARRGKPGMPGLEQIEKLLAKGGFDYMLLSGEEFEDADPADTLRVLQKFMLPHVSSARVISYVRPHAARTLSSFAEQMKIGLLPETPTLFHQRASKNRRFIYTPRLAAWADTFGSDFVVRPFVRQHLKAGSLLEDFIDTAFGPDTVARIEPMNVANESLCLEDIVALKIVQNHFATRERQLRLNLGYVLALALGAQERAGMTTKLQLHRQLAETIRRDYLEDAITLDKRFCGGAPIFRSELDREVDEALPEAQSFEPSDHFSPEAIRAITMMAGVMDKMLENAQGKNWGDFMFGLRVAALHEGRPIPAHTLLGQ